MKTIFKGVNMKEAIAAALLIGAALLSVSTHASEPAAREVCKQFIERSGYKVSDWGQSWNWTAIDNKDGSWSVGARFTGMPPGGRTTNLYVTCIAKKSGDNWKLEKLSRLQ